MRLLRQQDAVGGERQLGPQLREHFDQPRQLSPKERLAPGQADLLHPTVNEDASDANDLLKIGDLTLRQERTSSHLVPRHAVGTTKVTAIRHADAKIAWLSPETVRPRSVVGSCIVLGEHGANLSPRPRLALASFAEIGKIRTLDPQSAKILRKARFETPDDVKHAPLDFPPQTHKNSVVKLYAFDGIDETLSLVPLSARRALDAIGQKLSLAGFLELPLPARRALAAAGTPDVVDTDAAKVAIAPVKAQAKTIETLIEAPRGTVPRELITVLGPTRPLSDKVWEGLTALDRYSLLKVAKKNRPERVSGAYQEIVGQSAVSTHVRPQGGVHMVSISSKDITARRATAECWVVMSESAMKRLLEHSAPKGDVLSTARLAGIMATKRTADLIPLCHPLALTHAEIDFEEDLAHCRMRVICQVEVEAKTGVEMEAMVGANVAALTIYDMLKSIDRGMSLGPCRLTEKTGGRSGTFTAPSSPSPGANS